MTYYFFQNEVTNESRGLGGFVTNYFFKVKWKMKSSEFEAVNKIREIGQGFDEFWKKKFYEIRGGGGRVIWSRIGTFSQFEKHYNTSKNKQRAKHV